MKKIVILLLAAIPYLSGLDYSELPDDELVKMADNGDSEAQYQLGLALESLKYSKNQLRFDYIDQNPFNWYQKAAENSHGKSLTKIGKEYLTKFGHFKKQDYVKASDYFLRGSQSDPEAALLLSIIKYWGLEVAENKEEAMGFFKKSQIDFFRLKAMIYLEKELVEMVRELSREDNPDALFTMGDFYYFGQTSYYPQDYKKAFRLYTQAAELGNSNASYMLGMMYYDGTGILKDFRESYKWIIKGAEGGCIPAQVKAGTMSYFGEGTEINLNEAFKWLSMTAPSNDSLSQYFLGVMYFKGEGTEKDFTLAKKWIKEAFENGSTSAKKFWDAKEMWKIP